MISKERLEELIKNCEEIWHTQAPQPEPYILQPEENEWFEIEDNTLCLMKRKGGEENCEYAWLLENLFETQEEALEDISNFQKELLDFLQK